MKAKELEDEVVRKNIGLFVTFCREKLEEVEERLKKVEKELKRE